MGNDQILENQHVFHSPEHFFQFHQWGRHSVRGRWQVVVSVDAMLYNRAQLFPKNILSLVKNFLTSLATAFERYGKFCSGILQFF